MTMNRFDPTTTGNGTDDRKTNGSIESGGFSLCVRVESLGGAVSVLKRRESYYMENTSTGALDSADVPLWTCMGGKFVSAPRSGHSPACEEACQDHVRDVENDLKRCMDGCEDRHGRDSSEYM